jgi:hypothetical protein
MRPLSIPVALAWALIALTGVHADVDVDAESEPDLKSQYHLFHRLVSPSSTQEASPFTPRALLSLHPELRLVPDSNPALSFAFSEEEQGDGPSALPRDALYQLALVRPGDMHEGHFAISTVKACHLLDPNVNADRITLLQSPRDGSLQSVEYFLEGIPHDARCPRKSKKNPAGLKLRSLEEISLFDGRNTTIAFKQPRHPPLPVLKTPPPLSAEGTPVQPPQEKSFLQKYWMYIAIAVLGLSKSGHSCRSVNMLMRFM